MYTAPSHRSRGLASRILDELVYRASDLGYARLRLTTGTLQPDAVAVYAKAGFQRVPPYGVYAAEQFATVALCFEKLLNC